jgi:hypothetical protein
MDVVEADHPAVTHETIVQTAQDIERGSEGSPVGVNDLHTLLVSDVTTASGADTFALLAVNPLNDEMQGIVEKKGEKPFKINQARGRNGGKAVAEEETHLVAPDWNCDVAEEIPMGDEREEESYERKLMRDIHHAGKMDVSLYLLLLLLFVLYGDIIVDCSHLVLISICSLNIEPPSSRSSSSPLA